MHKTRPVFHFRVGMLSFDRDVTTLQFRHRCSPSLASEATSHDGVAGADPPVEESNGGEISCTREATENRDENRRVEDASRVTMASISNSVSPPRPAGRHLSLLGGKASIRLVWEARGIRVAESVSASCASAARNRVVC
jgi:hypothetical protein